MKRINLSQQFSAYSQWRTSLSEALGAFRNRLSEHELGDAQIDLRLTQLIDRLKEDCLRVAFVAEFSRGKSELINAIFFANYGSRILPSSVGRTTMCPTELMYDPLKSPCIELLPIRTRETNASVSEYKNFPEEWTFLPLDISSAEELQARLQSVSDVERVPLAVAEKLGFNLDNDNAGAMFSAEDGMVEIPRWRHAVINFPHPLLEQGLVILDTPGLNAVGAEPELTLSLIPNAHVVLYILAAHTGVTQSDLNVWNHHIGAVEGHKKGRVVVLNKIDTMWDELKNQGQIEAEINKQVQSCASMLNVSDNQVFPVSAQKALVAKINGDASLLERSRLPELEVSLSRDLVQGKQEVVYENTMSVFSEVLLQVRGVLDSRSQSLEEQLNELSELRGKNRNVVEYMVGKVRIEKEEFESALQRYYAVRSVFSQMTNKLFACLGLDALRALTSSTRQTMLKATFSKTLSEAIRNYFTVTRANLAKSSDEIHEIYMMMDAIYKKFSVEHNLQLGAPNKFSLMRYRKEIDRVEQWCNTNYTTFHLMTSDKGKVTEHFFSQVASQIRNVFDQANKDAETWIKAIVAPMETQVREHQIQLKRRLESIKRIHQASDTLEERIKELKHIKDGLDAQADSVEAAAQVVRNSLDEALEERVVA